MGRIDVVVPCYGYGRFLRECVQSVLAQDVDGLRVLIIDDASPDQTPEVGRALERADARVRYRRHVANQGHIATFNEGVAWAGATYMLLLSADDYLLPGALARALALLDADPAMGLCVGDARILLADGRLKAVQVEAAMAREPGRAEVVLSGHGFIEQVIHAGANNPVVCATAVVRTRLLRETGAYRADLPHCADLELWLRLASRGPVGIVRQPQAVYRRHQSNMSDHYQADHGLADLQQRAAAFDAFGDLPSDALPALPALLRRLRRALAREAVGQAGSAFNDGQPAVEAKLLAFAAATSPSAFFGRAWMRLRIKRALGVGRTNALRGWRDRWRGQVAAPGAGKRAAP